MPALPAAFSLKTMICKNIEQVFTVSNNEIQSVPHPDPMAHAQPIDFIILLYMNTLQEPAITVCINF